VHQDAFTAGHRVLVVDDVLATGGTAQATLDLVERAGGVVAGVTVLMELSFLAGRERLAPRPVHALLTV
jgi:adenine phosphoribosyltransferase